MAERTFRKFEEDIERFYGCFNNNGLHDVGKGGGRGTCSSVQNVYKIVALNKLLNKLNEYYSENPSDESLGYDLIISLRFVFCSTSPPADALYEGFLPARNIPCVYAGIRTTCL